jgi:hypothetical protein
MAPASRTSASMYRERRAMGPGRSRAQRRVIWSQRTQFIYTRAVRLVRPRGIFAAGAAIAAVMLACVGDDPVLSNTAGNDPDAATTPTDGGIPPLDPDAAPSLGCPLGCLPPAPSGWTGPSAVYDGPPADVPATCPPDYVQEEVRAFQGLADVPPAACTCGDPSVVPGSSKCDVELGLWTASGCAPIQGIKASDTFVPGDLANTCIAPGANFTHARVSKTTFLPGTCVFPNASKNVPSAIEKSNVACGLPQNAACNERPDCTATPLPQQGFTRLCIHKAGEASCPSHDYAVRFVAHRAIDDTRDCTCTGTVTGTCGTSFNFSNNSNCITGGTTVALDECVAIPTSQLIDLKGLGPKDVTCTANASPPTGTVTLTEPVTFCCNK